MGGFLGIGGSSAKTDRNQTLAGYQDLNNLFGFAFPTGQKGIATGGQTQQQGLSGVNDAMAHFKKLASGNRPAVLQEIAPSVNAANAQSDAAKRQQGEMGTSRGGGVAGANQQAETDKAAAIDNLLFGAASTGAEGEAKTGSAITQAGLGQSGQGINLVNTGLDAAQDVTADSITSRPDSFKINKSVQNDVKGGIMAALKMFA